MVNARIPEVTAMTVSGHVTRATFDRYSVVGLAEKQEAARRIAVASEEAARRVAATPSRVTTIDQV
jgi:hypothetical protein